MRKLTRREWLIGVLGFGALAGLGELLTYLLRRGPDAPPIKPRAFRPDLQRALDAAVERLFPGAVAAGVPEYIRYWVTRPPFDRAAGWRVLLKIGAVHLNRLAKRDHQRVFADCRPEQQDAILARFQRGEEPAKNFRSEDFFRQLLALTLEGMFSDPKYGGNRDGAGYALIGTHRCWWAPKKLRLIWRGR